LDKEELESVAESIQELLVERGRQNFIVSSLVEADGQPSAVKIIFRAEGKQ